MYTSGERVMITSVWKTNCIRQPNKSFTNSCSKELPCSVDGYKLDTVARILQNFQYRIPIYLLPCLFCIPVYFTDLHRPIESGSKPDSKIAVGVWLTSILPILKGVMGESVAFFWR